MVEALSDPVRILALKTMGHTNAYQYVYSFFLQSFLISRNRWSNENAEGWPLHMDSDDEC
jgi:hypothetical protein